VVVEEIYRSRKRSSVWRHVSYARVCGVPSTTKKCDARGKGGRKDLRGTGKVNEAFLVLTTV